MKSGVPWQVEGVRPHTRDTAQEAARRAGMSVGEWLDTIILDSARHDGVDRYHSYPPGRPAAIPRTITRPGMQDPSGLEQQLRQINTRIATLGRPCGLDHAIDTLRADLAEIWLLLQEAMPRKAVEALEAEVRRLADRIDRTRDPGTDAAAFTGIERGLAEVRDGLRGLKPAENLVGVDRAIQELSRKVDRLAGNAQHPSTLRQLEDAINAIGGMVPHVASNDALESLAEEVRALARKIDHAASSGGAGSLSALEQRIAVLADALEARNPCGHKVPDKVQDALELVHGTLGHIVDRLEWLEADMLARPAPPEPAPLAAAGSAPFDPNGFSTRAALKVAASAGPATPPRVSASAAETIEIAAAHTLKPSRPVVTERRPIEPHLPPDHPLEPGTAATHGRHALSHADRIAAEAVVGEIKLAVIPDPGGKSNFIAAARRAAQAAGRDGSGQISPQARGETASATGKLANRVEKLRALMVGVAAVVVVVGSLQVARTFLTAGDSNEAGTPIPSRRAVAAAPAAATAEVDAATAPPADERDATGTVASPGQSASPPALIATAPLLRAAPALISQAPSPSPASDKLPAAFGSVLRTAAANGDASAQYEVARRYFEGSGVPQDLTEAAEWFRRSAEQGMAPAQFRLAGLYQQGLGVKKDLEAARRFYLAAGEAGHAKALHNLAVLYAEGIDGNPDYRSAADWFRKAADYGMADSQYNLAILFARGIGVEQNLAESYKWFALAARAGDADAAKKRDDVGARLDQQSLQAASQAAQAWRAQPQPEMQVATPPGGWDPITPSAAAPAERKLPVAGPKPDLATPGSAQ